MIPAQEALKRLREGNARFINGESMRGPVKPTDMPDGQEPFAIILGCSDSRVPAELVFDQGLGDLFVIRVAGNIVAPSQVGSVEFAADKFQTRLVIVMGHTKCGAIQATVDQLIRPAAVHSPNLRDIVDRIRPAVAGLLDGAAESDALMRRAMRANVRASTAHLRHGSELLERLIRTSGLLVVGAEYSVETGVVDFFDGAPGAA